MARRKIQCKCGGKTAWSMTYDLAFCWSCKRWLEKQCECAFDECEFSAAVLPADATGLKDDHGGDV